MAAGFAGGGSCWATVAEAAAAQCGSIGGTAASGVASCDSVVSTSTSSAVLAYRFTSAEASTVVNATVELPACEQFDVAGFWLPLLGVTFLAVITILCLRMAVRPFRREGL